MSKHQEIISYLENLPIGKRVSVRSISNYLGVSDGTAYRAIKEAENRGLVETRPRSGTVRVKSKAEVLEHLTYREIADVTGSEVLAGHGGLDKEFSKFSIGAMTRENIVRYLGEGGLVIVGDRVNIQLLALQHDNAVLVTGGFLVDKKVLELADDLDIPVLRVNQDTYTVATVINRALNNIQIKTDIITVEKVYRSGQEYGFLYDTDTVKDYLNLVAKNRFSRFPVVNRHNVVVGVVTMRDAGDKTPNTLLNKVMSKTVFTTELSASIANVSQHMIAEDFEMIPVIRGNAILVGVITRRDVMEKMSSNQVSNLPTFSDRIVHKLAKGEDGYSFTVEPFMLEKNGSLSHGVLTEILMNASQQIIQGSGKNLMIEQLMIYFFQAVQLDDYLRIRPEVIRQTRRSAIIDYHIELSDDLIAKATVTVKIN